jgi:hypothetical protein
MPFLRIDNGYKTSVPWLLLGSRLTLFLLFQSLGALILNSWGTSQKYWLVTSTLTNVVSIILLYILFKREKVRYINLFRFNRALFRKDILIFIGLAIIIGPIAFFPNILLSNWFWGSEEVPFNMMFQPIESWLTYILLLAFPITITFAELATYFGYIMPRLEKQLNSKWLSILLPVFFLSIQHCTLPFIPDIKFIIYRGLVFLPFSLLLGISIRYRPTLFPYFAILHGIMDFGAAIMFITI